MTVGELAYSMHFEPARVQRAAKANSLFERLDESRISATLDALAREVRFVQRGWDLSLLDNFSKPWATALRDLYSIPVSYPASLPPTQGIQIRELVLRERPTKVLEIGCFIGISSHWIASALDEIGAGHVDSVDTFRPKYPLPFHFSYLADPYTVAMSACGRSDAGSRITFHRSSSRAFAASTSGAPLYDFMFIDGDHTLPGIAQDFFTWFPRLRVGGTILLHDVNPDVCGWTGPRALIDRYLLMRDDVSVEEITTEPNFGMAIVRKLHTTRNTNKRHQPLTRAYDRLRLGIRITAHRIWLHFGASPVMHTLGSRMLEPLIARFWRRY